MLTSKAAAESALKYVSDVFSQDVDAGRIVNVLIEEIDRDENGDWLITLGWDQRPNYAFGTGFPVLPVRRVYKQFRISATSGEVVWMKIRNAN